MPSKEYMREYRAKNKERIKELQTRWRQENIDKVRTSVAKANKAYRDRNRAKPSYVAAVKRTNKKSYVGGYKKNWLLLKKYGISLEARDAMLARQGGNCAGCGSRTPNWRGDWHVDHCHRTGRVRGILCHNCNTTLGRADDDPSVLRRLALYIENNNKNEASD